MSKAVLMGLYKHYKKGTRYRVTDIAMHSETQELLVIYQEYGNPRNPIWARPKGMFEETLIVDGKEVERFERI